MSKKYVYKVYDKSNNYLTSWSDEVVSEFSISKEINSAGSQVMIKLPRNAGDYGEGSDVDFGYRIKIYCFDTENPNGLLIFQGYISTYEPDYSGNSLDVTVLSDGADFDTYMLQEPTDLVNSMVATNGRVTGRRSPTYAPDSSFAGDTAGAGDWFRTGVKFTTPSSMTQIAQLDACFHHKNTYTLDTDTALLYPVTLTVYPLLTSGARSGYPDYTQPLGSSTLPVGTLPTSDFAGDKTYDALYAKPVIYSFPLTSSITVVPSTNYCFVLESPTALSAVFNGVNLGDMWCEWTMLNSEALKDSYAYTGSGDMTLADNVSTAMEFTLGGNWLSKIKVNLRKDGSPTGNITMKVYEHTGTYQVNGTPSVPYGSTPLATSTTVINSASLGAGFADTSFLFSGNNSCYCKANTYYCFTLDYAGTDGANTPVVEFKLPTTHGNASYWNGSIWQYNWGAVLAIAFYAYGKNTNSTGLNYYNSSISGSVAESYSSTLVIPFGIYQPDGTTTITYTLADPSSILKDIIDKYNFIGGVIRYDDTSIDLTGATTTYEFKANTILEGIKKCLELAPSGWYWYVDYPTNLIHFHEQAVTPKHLFGLEKDILNLKIRKSIENIINTIYFTGGDTGAGVNFYKKFYNQDSITKYGVKSSKYIDQNVTTLAVAQTIANAILEKKSQPELRVDIDVIDSNGGDGLGYDLETIDVGDVVSVRNINQTVGLSTWDVARWDEAYWDYNIYNLSSLQLQVQKMQSGADVLSINASTVAPDINKKIEEINRSLISTQTLNNPINPT